MKEEAAQEERIGRQTRGGLRTCCTRGAILHVRSSFIFLEILLLRVEFLLIYRLLPYARFYLRANRLIRSRPAAPAVVQKTVRERECNRHCELNLQQRRTEYSSTRSNARRLRSTFREGNLDYLPLAPAECPSLCVAGAAAAPPFAWPAAAAAKAAGAAEELLALSAAARLAARRSIDGVVCLTTCAWFAFIITKQEHRRAVLLAIGVPQQMGILQHRATSMFLTCSPQTPALGLTIACRVQTLIRPRQSTRQPGMPPACAQARSNFPLTSLTVGLHQSI